MRGDLSIIIYVVGNNYFYMFMFIIFKLIIIIDFVGLVIGFKIFLLLFWGKIYEFIIEVLILD